MSSAKKLVRVLEGGAESPPPVWLMRQAGRYLPEYRALREKAGSFWGMALNPDFAAEVTIQPVRRFGFDAAILFSDILTVPEALGRKVIFTAGEGPSMTPVTDVAGFDSDPARWESYFEPVYAALRQTRAGLDREGFGDTALLGFAGAPWTLATYLAAGAGGDEQKAARLWAYRDPQGFARLLDILADCVVFHLVRQLRAGADAVQIFDSWASGLPPPLFEQLVIAPTRKIVAAVRAEVPGARIIGFPRAATLAGYEAYVRATGVDAVSLDTAAPLDWAGETLACTLQGNLDPIALVAGGMALDRAVGDILEAMAGKPFIFNLGHGILQETPIAHVEQLLKRVRG
ncbi:MAG: uroporphyrinogen decarboxylase [Alphaproteobacteria bacterium 64-11]|nr:uroporphyrinogen decarboxylase [Alphaproteobacteria bacterium]OJU10914.1 MAG: uroporphyrinogen decarboxylase [Alphaproteobacteria bacterium 64-11]